MHGSLKITRMLRHHCPHQQATITATFNGQFADAAVAYREAIALAPENPVWWGNLGDALQQIDGGGKEAQLAYRKAADLAAQLLPANPADGELLTNLAHYQSRLGDDERASQYLARALFASPDDVYAHYYAALVHLGAMARLRDLSTRGTAITKEARDDFFERRRGAKP